jgi:hypothetical protein
MKKFKQTNDSIFTTLLIFSILFGWVVGYCTNYMEQQKFNSIVASIVTFFIGWIAITVQVENKEIARKKLILDSYKEKETIEKEILNIFYEYKKCFKILGQIVIATNENQEKLSKINSYAKLEEVLILFNKVYQKYIFILKLTKIDIEKLERIHLKINNHKSNIFANTREENLDNSININDTNNFIEIQKLFKTLEVEIANLEMNRED